MKRVVLVAGTSGAVTLAIFGVAFLVNFKIGIGLFFLTAIMLASYWYLRGAIGKTAYIAQIVVFTIAEVTLLSGFRR